MKAFIIAAVGLGLCVSGCFGQVADGGSGTGSPTPAPTGSPQGPQQAPPSSQPSEPSPPQPPQSAQADAGDGGTTPSGCVSDSGTVCGLADGQTCNGDQECASDICFANGSAGSGMCSELCNAQNEKTVCTFGQQKCSDANNGICLP